MDVTLEKTPYGQAHPKWLFSCSLYLPIEQGLLHLHPTDLTDLPTCPRAQIMIGLTSATKIKGQWGTCPSSGFPGDQWVSLTSIPPITGNLSSPSEGCHHVVSRVYCTRWGVAPGLCLGQISSSHPFNHWCVCCWLQAPSLVLKLGKDRACKSVGYL